MQNLKIEVKKGKVSKFFRDNFSVTRSVGGFCLAENEADFSFIVEGGMIQKLINYFDFHIVLKKKIIRTFLLKDMSNHLTMTPKLQLMNHII